VDLGRSAASSALCFRGRLYIAVGALRYTIRALELAVLRCGDGYYAGCSYTSSSAASLGSSLPRASRSLLVTRCCACSLPLPGCGSRAPPRPSSPASPSSLFAPFSPMSPRAREPIPRVGLAAACSFRAPVPPSPSSRVTGPRSSASALAVGRHSAGGAWLALAGRLPLRTVHTLPAAPLGHGATGEPSLESGPS